MFSYAPLNEIIDRIVTKFSPEKIIIFGSVAKGTAGPDSDVDVLVIMDTELPYYKRAAPIRSAMRGVRAPVDILVLTQEEYDRLKENEFSFANEIYRTGVTAYEA